MNTIPTLQEMKDILWEKYCESIEDRNYEMFDESDDGKRMLKVEYFLTEDEMAQELDYEDFADFIREYLSEELDIVQPEWVTNWMRENLRSGVAC